MPRAAHKTKPAAKTAKVKSDATAPIITTGSIADFAPPPPSGGGRKLYPIETLEPGQFFGVAGKAKRDMAGLITRSNAKYRTTGKDGDGNTKVLSTEREFYAVDVDAVTAEKLKGTDHEGATVLIVRKK